MERYYRSVCHSHLKSYEITYKESNLFIEACEDSQLEAFEILRRSRKELESYISYNNEFFRSLEPIKNDKRAPILVQRMIEASHKAGVGPMACVAGAIADVIGRFLLKRCDECVVENGGDIFLKLNQKPIIGIVTNNRYFKDKLSIEINKSNFAYGICSSSATIGPSLSQGSADLSLIVSHDVLLSDALATASANIIKNETDLNSAVDFVRGKDIIGCLFIKDKSLAVWGDLKII